MNERNYTLVHQFLEHSAEAYPGKVAVIADDFRPTYKEINLWADQFAAWLINTGVSHGDRIVIVLMNSIEYIVSYYGAMKAGAVPVALSTGITADGLVPILQELEPFAMVTSQRFEKVVNEAMLSFNGIQQLLIKDPQENWNGIKAVPWDDIIGSNDHPSVKVEVLPGDLSSIIYTSGSTGTPKGVMLTHGNIVANVNSICQYLKLTESDIQMVVLPFFYVMGKSLLNTHFAVGGTVVLNNRFAFTASVIKQMAEENVTGFSGVPSTYAYLLHRSPLGKYKDKLPHLRYCSQAGGHMSRQIKEQLRNVLPSHTDIYIMYGATEASARLTYLEPDCYAEKIDSIGRAIPGVVMRVVDDKGQEVSVGEVGELTGAGDNIMQGYWKDPELSSRVLDHNGYHTGDLGYRDEEGYLYLVGRKDNILKVSGHRINPQEIEDIIMTSGLVVETAVVGIADELQGNRLIAVLVPIEKDCNKEDIINYCVEKLPKYKIPSDILMIRSLPKKESGKVDRGGCKKIAEES